MLLLRLIAVMLLASSTALPLSQGAFTAPLDKEACADLQVQHKRLLTREIQEALARGPDWVKEHLNHEKIEQVREYLKVEEKVIFRCRGGGVAKVQPPTVPLPDRKPVLPSASVAAAATASAATDIPLPDRKPSSDPVKTETQPSQAVADSDKTAPSETKATP
jgi:hypothetical protein